MPKPHIPPKTLEAYLDKRLDPAERAAIWEHLQGCPRCEARLAEISRLQVGVSQHHVLGTPRQEELSAFLPGILLETRRAPAWQPNRLGILIGMLLAVVLLLPMVPNFDLSGLATAQPLLNANAPMPSHATQIGGDDAAIQHSTTLEAAQQDQERLPDAFNMQYASPVPPPIATLAPSQMP